MMTHPLALRCGVPAGLTRLFVSFVVTLLLSSSGGGGTSCSCHAFSSLHYRYHSPVQVGTSFTASRTTRVTSSWIDRDEAVVNLDMRHNRRRGRVSLSTRMSSSKDSGNQDINIPVEEEGESQVQTSESAKPQQFYDAIVCGGGPAGLLAAIMLAQKAEQQQEKKDSYSIAVCERRPVVPPSPWDTTLWESDVARFYLLGMGHRGQGALRQFGLYDDFVQASVAVNGRRDWAPGKTAVEDGKITPANKDVTSRVLAREKLVGLLHQIICQRYSEYVHLLYGYQVEPTDFGLSSNDDPVSVLISKCDSDASKSDSDVCDADSFQLTKTNFLLAADGSAQTVANVIERQDKEHRNQNKSHNKQPLFRVTRFDDDNPRVYKSVPIQLPSDWPCDLNYSARSTQDSRIILEALPSDGKGSMCALLLMKPNDELAQPNVDPQRLWDFFDQEFPQFGALITQQDMAKVAQKRASTLPSFRYVGPRLSMGHRTLILGDAAHTVKPYFGLGANSALEDVQILSDCLDESSKATGTTSTNNNPKDAIPKAVELFSKRRSADAKALVTISRNMDRPGKLFYVYFLIPLILDSLFHKMAPRIFGPNMFGMFQKKGMGFHQIQQKKRLDRTLQVLCLGTLLTGMGFGTKCSVCALARWTGTTPTIVSAGMASIATTGMIFRKLFLSKNTGTEAKQ